jgi:hypothetical protein
LAGQINLSTLALKRVSGTGPLRFVLKRFFFVRKTKGETSSLRASVLALPTGEATGIRLGFQGLIHIFYIFCPYKPSYTPYVFKDNAVKTCSYRKVHRFLFSEGLTHPRVVNP